MFAPVKDTMTEGESRISVWMILGDDIANTLFQPFIAGNVSSVKAIDQFWFAPVLSEIITPCPMHGAKIV